LAKVPLASNGTMPTRNLKQVSWIVQTFDTTRNAIYGCRSPKALDEPTRHPSLRRGSTGRDFPRYLHQRLNTILEWFHVSMKLTVEVCPKNCSPIACAMTVRLIKDPLAQEIKARRSLSTRQVRTGSTAGTHRQGKTTTRMVGACRGGWDRERDNLIVQVLGGERAVAVADERPPATG